MRIEMPSRPVRGESIIPMINVVFLLLIFFLLTAQIAPSTPFELDPPKGASDVAAQDLNVLYVSATGQLSYNGQFGDAALGAVAAREDLLPLEIRADGKAPAAVIAQLLNKLSEVGLGGADLVVSGG